LNHSFIKRNKIAAKKVIYKQNDQGIQAENIFTGVRGLKKNRVLILFTLLVISIFIGGYIYFFKPNQNVVPAFEESRLYLVLESEVLKDEPKIIDGEVCLSLETIKQYIDPYIYWDEALQKVTITTKDRVIRMKTDSLSAYVNNEPVELNIPVTIADDKVYVPIEFLSDFYGIEVNYIKESNVVTIDFKSSVQQIAEPIDEDAVVRKDRSVKSPILKRLNEDMESEDVPKLRIFEEYEKWYKVRTEERIVGYIQKKHVVVKKVVVTRIPEEYTGNVAWRPQNGKISLVWHMMYNGIPDLTQIGEMKGLDVISPTWFQLANAEGDLINRASAKYVEWAHKRGYQVWALFSNTFNDVKMTGDFLNNTDSRDNAIRQLLSYAALYDLDGINIDFENINIEDKDALTQFVRELTPLLKEQGLVVSMDIGVPDGSENYSLCYDREAIGQIVDYVMVMTYDQHWSTSPKAGSVAQLKWVESKLVRTLESIPREKLLLGLPFYTRLWKEETDSNGAIKVTHVEAPSMEKARAIIEENDAQVVWDDESGQFYAEFEKDGAKYKIWIESAESINLKSSLAQKYNLAGVAAWKRGDETPDIWEVLSRNLEEYKSYNEWQEANSGIEYAYSE